MRGSENRWGAAKTDGGTLKQMGGSENGWGVGATDGRQLKWVKIGRAHV